MVKNGITVSELNLSNDKDTQVSLTVNLGEDYVHCFLDTLHLNIIEFVRYGVNDSDFLIKILRKDFNVNIGDDAL